MGTLILWALPVPSHARPLALIPFSVPTVAEPRPPLLRVLGAVENGVNNDGIGGRFVENLVRKAPHKRTAKLLYSGRIEMRVPLDGQDTRLDTPKKLFAESWLTALISVVGVCNIVVGLLGENDAFNHAAHAPSA
jgi:hypothetical protein